MVVWEPREGYGVTMLGCRQVAGMLWEGAQGFLMVGLLPGLGLKIGPKSGAMSSFLFRLFSQTFTSKAKNQKQSLSQLPSEQV